MQECLLLSLALVPASHAQEFSTLAPVDITPLFEGLSDKQQQRTQFNFQPQPAVPGLQVTPAPDTTPRPVRIRIQKEELVTAKPELPQGT